MPAYEAGASLDSTQLPPCEAPHWHGITATVVARLPDDGPLARNRHSCVAAAISVVRRTHRHYGTRKPCRQMDQHRRHMQQLLLTFFMRSIDTFHVVGYDAVLYTVSAVLVVMWWPRCPHVERIDPLLVTNTLQAPDTGQHLKRTTPPHITACVPCTPCDGA